MNNFTDTEKKIFKTIFGYSDNKFQQKELAKLLNIAGSNMSNYFKKLKSKGVIELVDDRGKDKFYRLAGEYKLLAYEDTAINNVIGNKEEFRRLQIPLL